ncbi:MAG: hypothetical protein ACOX18_06230 [Bacillota bacterium]
MEESFTLGEVDVVELAKALLGEQSPADFLETGEPITADYEATVSYKNAEIELAGTLTFQVEGTKAGFLGKLAEEVEKIDVADVVLEGADIIVTFPEDVEVTAVAQAAADLVAALLQYAGDDSTLTVNGKTFTLGEVDVVELAKALLGDQSPADFLETGEPITADYEATVSYKNAEIELAGTLTFQVEGTKAGFLGKLAEEVEKIDVADVVLEGADIIVTFPEDVEVTAVAQAAADLVAALLQYAGDDSTLTVNGKTFTLGEVDVVELAKALLGDQSPADFLETGEPITADYEATVSYKNAEIELAGTLTFQVEGTKAGFLGKLAEEVEKIDVADVVLEGADIIVTFPEDVEVTAVAQAAADLVAALLQYAGDDSTLIVNGKTFTLGEVDVVELAKALLGDQSPADFLETGEPIVANYTATVSYKNAEIELAGTLTFRVVGTKAGFLGKLAEEVEKIDVADVVLEGADIIVTFPEDVEVSAVAQAAADLVAALRQYAGDDSTLIVNGKSFTLGECGCSGAG